MLSQPHGLYQSYKNPPKDSMPKTSLVKQNITKLKVSTTKIFFGGHCLKMPKTAQKVFFLSAGAGFVVDVINNQTKSFGSLQI